MFRSLVMLALSLASLNTLGATEEDAFSVAEKSYESGDFAGALASYENAWTEGLHDSTLLFNLGNAAYRSEELGKAVAAFLAARELDPRDADIATNLSFAMRKLPSNGYGNSDQDSWLVAFQPLFSLKAEEAYILAAVLWFLGLTCLALRAFIYLPRGVIISAALIFFLSVYVIAGIAVRRSLPHWGAVCAKTLSLRSEPSVTAAAVTDLNEGTPVAFKNFLRSWMPVSTGDGKSGWVEGKDLCYFDTGKVW